MDNVSFNKPGEPNQNKENVKKERSHFSTAQNQIKSFGDFFKYFTGTKLKQRVVEPISGASKLYNQNNEEINKSKLSKDGEIIYDQFYDTQGNEIGREVVTRIKTVEVYKQQLHTELEYLQKAKLENLVDQYTVEKRIQRVEKKMKYANHMLTEWASTNSGRYIFSKLSENEAREIGVPVLRNLRQHLLRIGDIGISVNRSGAVTDLGHAETNLMEIVDFEYLTKLNPAERPIDAKIYHFKDYYGVDITNQSARLELIRLMRSRIKKAYGPQQLAHIKDIEEDRRAILQSQVFQDLLVHFRTKPADQEQVLYSRLAYLDPTKPPEIDRTTNYHNNEKNQFLDMKAIYDELDGAELIFDLKTTEGPYIDLQGRIHMPKDCCHERLNTGSSITLNTVFMNCSVQNNQKNEGLQKIVNREAMQKLRMLGLPENQSKRVIDVENDIMNKKETDFDLAHQITDFLKEISYMSVDCYGGKDRTGYALALETYHILRSVVRKKANADPEINKDYSKIMSIIRMQLVGPRGVAVRITEDNTGCKVLKISGFMLKLYVSGKGLVLLRGISKRLSDYLEAAKMFMPEPLVVHPNYQSDSILFDNEEEIEALRKQKAA